MQTSLYVEVTDEEARKPKGRCRGDTYVPPGAADRLERARCSSPTDSHSASLGQGPGQGSGAVKDGVESGRECLWLS